MADKGKRGLVNMTPRNELPAGVVPDCLVWELVKDNNAHLFKSGTASFTKERYNIMAKNTPVYSGLLQKGVMDIELAQSGSKILFKSMKLQDVRRPRSRTHLKKLSRSLAHVDYLRKISDETRPDLTPLLLQKYAKIAKAKIDVKLE
ncbi:uncharacterized protein BXIN_0381 [Babesia sp. Xinjiang]|uniref:uncharacterized protein n=1 Tax=Babesia sp. Xinjiang TaxID=462227 RepID=UPI000A23543F|nr:uncharacterized protein BXIN_0381 [Babesia sp. Xinjiang]ORM41066.1 hypothetical protein BXIN_0381 [Babesia sp. Xinjiang]